MKSFIEMLNRFFNIMPDSTYQEIWYSNDQLIIVSYGDLSKEDAEVLFETENISINMNLTAWIDHSKDFEFIGYV